MLARLALLLLVLVLPGPGAGPGAGAGAAAASTIDLDPPATGEFVLDGAGLLSADQKSEVEGIAAKLFQEHQTPIVVVTITSMAEHWRHGEIRIETFAHLLFDQWEIGAAELGGEVWNTGILLLVSRNDRKARIQLGDGWGREQDGACLRIMNDRIIPEFKRDRYGQGILAGVRALDAMARGKAPPATRSGSGGPAEPGATGASRSTRGVSPTRSGPGLSVAPFCCGAVLLLAIVAVVLPAMSRGSLGGRGLGGVGWGAGGLLGGLLLGRMFSGRDYDNRGGRGGGFFGGGGFRGGGGGGGGFSGGGFRGGGFSGGGGASGRW